MASLLERGIHSFSKEDLLACSRGELFGPGNSQLPAPNMLMFDRITHIDDTGGEHGLGFIQAELDITPDLWFSHVISREILLCRVVSDLMPCGN